MNSGKRRVKSGKKHEKTIHAQITRLICIRYSSSEEERKPREKKLQEKNSLPTGQ
jgi:hypothetical protein